MIPVTKPFLPPYEQYSKYVQEIWNRNWLTNNGPIVNQFELRLKEYLGIEHLAYVNNGTIALQLAITAFDLRGEIITTPFSYVATTSSIVWQNCKPIFVDIDRDSLNIDVDKIQDAITPQTVAIMATHVYGNPCDIDGLTKLAKKNGLKLIFDAAHCFGTKYRGKSIYAYGDISTASFHATKLFHTIEGGALFTSEPDTLKKISWLRNFGHNGPEDFHGCGINGKNSEFHAAMGLCLLDYVDEIFTRRRYLSDYYSKKLVRLRHTTPVINKDADYNYAYYPIILESENFLLKVVKILNDHLIFPRRYFYPSLNTLSYVETLEMPVSDDVSKRVLCLPLYHTLKENDIDLIIRLMLRAQNY